MSKWLQITLQGFADGRDTLGNPYTTGKLRKGSPQKVAVWEGKSPYFREIMVKTPEPSTVASTRRPSQKESMP